MLEQSIFRALGRPTSCWPDQEERCCRLRSAGVSGSGGGPVVASYTVAAPAGTWRRGNRGSYKLLLQPQQVRDTNGYYAAAEGLARFTLHVVQCCSRREYAG